MSYDRVWRVAIALNHYEVLSRDLTQAICTLKENGPRAYIQNAQVMHSHACELWRQYRSPKAEELWLNASIVYQLSLAGEKLDWHTMSETVPLSPQADGRAFHLSDRPDNVRLYHLFIANMAIIGTMSESSTWERTATYLASNAARCFAKEHPRTRWYGAVLLIPAYWSSLSSESHNEDIKVCAQYVLRLLRDDPAMELCAFARLLAGEKKVMILESKGRFGIGKKYREPFFSRDDLYSF